MLMDKNKIHDDSDWMENWENANKMNFNRDKCSFAFL